MTRTVPRLAVALALACGGEESLPVMRPTAPPLIASEITPPTPISAEADGMGFAMASVLVANSDRLVVLETGNERLVVLDRQFRPVRYIGRAGAGPGELRGAMGLAAWRNEYAVAEVTNARVSVFDTSGAFIRSFPVPNGLSHLGYGPDGTIYLDSYDRENYLFAAGPDGALRPVAPRPLDLYPADVLASPRSRISGYVRFAVTPDGSIHVFDPNLAALITFDPGGRSSRIRRLPARIEAALREKSALMARDFGGDGRAAPAYVSGVSLTDDGRLLLVFSNVGAIGLLVEPLGGRVREIRWGPEVDPASGGYGGVVLGDLFYRLSSDDLRLFRLSPP